MATTPGVRCHPCFSGDPAVRYTAHRAAFSGTPFEKVPRWWLEPHVNLEEYLREYALELTPKNERAVGVRLTYGAIEQHQLWEYLETRLKEGGFCVIHFERPPLDCFTSFQMAERSRSRVFLDQQKAYSFVRRHMAARERVKRLFGDDLASVAFRDWVQAPTKWLWEIAEYIGLSKSAVPSNRSCPQPGSVFAPGALRRHLLNLATIVAEAPPDVREVLDVGS